MEYRVRAVVPKEIVIAIDDFTRGYLGCAEWCGLDEEERQALELSVSPKWSLEALIEAVKVCEEFQLRNEDNLAESGLDSSRAGHDFWLTRNRHGSGFWDEEGDARVMRELTDESYMYGEQTVVFDAESEELGFC
jgi:hypothetical protein